MVKALREYFEEVKGSDVHDYGAGFRTEDFLMPFPMEPVFNWIITNPPFRLAEQFANRALEFAMDGVALLCRLQWLEGGSRYTGLFEKTPPTKVLVFCDRVAMVKGRYDPDATTATAYAWFIWRRGHMRRKVRGPELQWIPPGTKARLYRAGDDVLP